jgi:rhamnose transport system substrate-binding protein
MTSRKLLAVLLGAMLILAACGGDGGSSTNNGGETGTGGGSEGGVVRIEGGEDFSSVFIPKSTDNPVFTQANQGAEQAAKELGTDPASYEGPSSAEDIESQIQIVTNAGTQGLDAVMISNAGSEGVEPAVQQVAEQDVTVVSWDSPIPGGTDSGEDLFIAQVDFDETGQVMADMALELLPDGGEFAILSATPDAANQNAWIASMEKVLKGDKYKDLKLVDTVYGNDDPIDSTNQALALVDKYPNLKLIMAPTTVGILAAAQAIQEEGLCGEVLVSGLGLPDEMAEYTKNGCAPKFALWSFVDLGYLAYYAAYGIATGQIEAVEGQQFVAGRMGKYTIEKDPTRDNALRVVMGPFNVYDKSNVDG